MKLSILLLMLSVSTLIFPLTLQNCFTGLEQNYPTSKNNEIYRDILQQEVSRLNKNWLPVLKLTSSYIYNSETTEINIDFPPTMNIDLPKADNDRMNVSLELQQQIFDAGLTKYSKQLKQQQNQVNILSEDAALHQLKTYTATLFLSIKLLETQNDILNARKQNLQITQSALEARYREGLLEKSELDLIKYEVLSIGEKLAENAMKISTARSTLFRLCGIAPETELELPEISDPEDLNIERAELLSFTSSDRILETNKKMISSRFYPRLYGFGSLSYGKPGYDQFSKDLHYYYSAGVGLQWDLWDFGVKKDELTILNYQQRLIKANKNKFLLELENKSTEIENEISFYQGKLSTSQEKINLISNVEAAYAAKLQKGVISSSEFLMQSNKLLSAQLEFESDRLNLLNARIHKILLYGGKL